MTIDVRKSDNAEDDYAFEMVALSDSSDILAQDEFTVSVTMGECEPESATVSPPQV